MTNSPKRAHDTHYYQGGFGNSYCSIRVDRYLTRSSPRIFPVVSEHQSRPPFSRHALLLVSTATPLVSSLDRLVVNSMTTDRKKSSGAARAAPSTGFARASRSTAPDKVDNCETAAVGNTSSVAYDSVRKYYEVIVFIHFVTNQTA